MSSNVADIAVTGGVVVNSREMKRADVYITDGLVDSVEPAGSGRQAKKTIDAGGRFVLPGIIDAHLHPVYADRIDTLSQAAVWGGITTLIPYVGAVKAWGMEGGLVGAIDTFIEEGETTSVIDFGYHCSLVSENIETIGETMPKLIDTGVTSFKGFMTYARRGMLLSDEELLRVMKLVAEHGALFAVHAENGPLVDYLEDKFIAEGKETPEYYFPSHPNIAEAEAVFRSLSLASAVDCPMYLPHLTCKESLEVVRLFRKWGAPSPLYAETCTHFLTLTDAEMTRRGSLAKVGPPLRLQEDIEALWRAVDEGVIDVVASDSGGPMMEKKEPLFEKVFQAPFGFPGQETMFTVIYDEGINQGRVTLPRLVQVTTENPARIFGLYPQKGVLENGSDADLVIFDPSVRHRVEAANQHVKIDYTMYEGRECLGAPVLVMQRGKVLLEDGELKATPGQGKFLPRKRISLSA